MKLLIAEEALRSLQGHWFEYLRSIVVGCRRAGDDVTIACHRDAVPEVVEELAALPIFPSSAWDPAYVRASGGAWRRLTRIFRHNAELYRVARRLLRRQGPFDVVFVPTILIDHLGAWALAARTARRDYGKLILFFVNGHGSYGGPGKPTAFPRSPNTIISRVLLRSLRKLVVSGKVVLAAETRAMVAEFTRFCGLPFQYMPHPVEPSAGAENVDLTSVGETRGQIVLSCLGFARYEKGSDLLQTAILRLRSQRPDLGQVRFVIQWLDDFEGPCGLPCTREPALLADPAVEFLSRSFTPLEYGAQLARTDGMILPYRARSYYARVSRVAIEAAMLGIPMVYTRATWLEDLVKDCGAGLDFADEDVTELTAQIVRLVDEFPAWREAARAKAATARRRYSPQSFRDCLLAGAG
jgi:glycosyltransferase involved in cell wall biosynthesis